MPFGTIVARGSRTHGSNVAFGSLRPFGPGSNVARGLRTRGSNVAFGSLRPFGPGSNVARGSRTHGSNVAFGSLRPFGPGLNVARGLKRTRLRRFAAPVYLTNQEIMSHPYIHFGTIVTRGSRTRGWNVAFGSLRPEGPG